jgi:hypothetical protein
MLLQISQRIDIRTRRRPPIDIDIAIPIHATRTPELYWYDYQTNHPQYEEYEGAHYHYAGEELPLGY